MVKNITILILALICIPLSQGYEILPSFIENGINVTTYSGLFIIQDAGGISNPQNADDGDYTTYAGRSGTSPNRIEYHLNFTTEETPITANFSSKGFQSTTGCRYYYCYDFNINQFIMMGPHTSLTNNFSINQSCLGTPTTNLMIKDNCSNANPSQWIESALHVTYIFQWLNLSFYDENTLTLLNGENLTLQIIQGSTINTYELRNGTYTERDTYSGIYTLKIQGTNYSLRQYQITIPQYESYTANIYLGNRTDCTIFTTKNRITGDILENVLIQQYTFLNETLNYIGSQTTDINGQIQFCYEPNQAYYFNATHPDYEEKTFTLDPIISTEYTILMTPTGISGSGGDYYGVNIIIDPHIYTNGTQNNATVTITSNANILSTYEIKYTYPGGTQTQSGNTPSGETFLFNFNIVGYTPGDQVIVRVTYTTIGNQTRTYQYPFLIETAGANTLAWWKGQTYGLGLMERVLIMLLFSFGMAAAIMLAGGTLESGLGLALLIQGFMAYLLSINVLFIIPGTIAGILLIMRRTQ